MLEILLKLSRVYLIVRSRYRNICLVNGFSQELEFKIQLPEHYTLYVYINWLISQV